MDKYDSKLLKEPFGSYNEYMEYIFDCVNIGVDKYIDKMKVMYASGDGGYKNVLYPDIEVVSDLTSAKIERFYQDSEDENDSGEEAEEEVEDTEDDEDEPFDEELLSLLGNFGAADGPGEEKEKREEPGRAKVSALSITEKLDFIKERAALTVKEGTRLPFFELCEKLGYEPFTVFCFACGILSSTQTDYAGVFQIINENMNLSAPTIESAARVFYGDRFSITGAYGDMSTCLEQLLPLLSLSVMKSMPFSTVVSPDKRIIDCLFGRNPDKLDEDYSRFISMLTNNGK